MMQRPKKLAVAVTSLICIGIAVAWAAPLSLAQEDLKRMGKRSVFMVVDANGKKVGQVVGFGGARAPDRIPAVAFKIINGSDEYQIILNVFKDALVGDEWLCFTNDNCTGTPYVIDRLYGSAPMPMLQVAVDCDNYLYLQSSDNQQMLTVESALGYDYLTKQCMCLDFPPSDWWVVPVEQTAIDLDNEFTPPFSIGKRRIKE